MKTYNTVNEAAEAAQQFFKDTFNYNDGVGIESRTRSFFEFYSKNDPAMEDTFMCIVKNY